MDVEIFQPDATHFKVLSELGTITFADTFNADNPEDVQTFLDLTDSIEIQTKEISQKIYDFIGSTPEESIELQRIYVDKSCAGKDIGKQLLQKTIAKAEELGKKNNLACAWEFNPSAIKFYEKHSFCKVKTHTFKFLVITDQIMGKHLSY